MKFLWQFCVNTDPMNISIISSSNCSKMLHKQMIELYQKILSANLTEDQ